MLQTEKKTPDKLWEKKEKEEKKNKKKKKKEVVICFKTRFKQLIKENKQFQLPFLKFIFVNL